MKVLTVDDDMLVAQSLSTVLSVEIDIEVVGLGRSGLETIEEYRELKPDILLIDIRMPGGDEFSAAERVLAGDVVTRIVFLTAFSDGEYIARALRMGSHDYLIKQDVAQIAPALQSVMAEVYILEGGVLGRGTTMRLSARPEPGGPQDKPLRDTVFAALTDHEYEVVEAVAKGLNNAEVAARLFMSEDMVCNHISSILAKLGLRNRTQMAVMYYRSVQAGQRSIHEEADAAIVAGTTKRYRGVTGLCNDLELHVLKTILSSEYRKDFKRAKRHGSDVWPTTVMVGWVRRRQ